MVRQIPIRVAAGDVGEVLIDTVTLQFPHCQRAAAGERGPDIRARGSGRPSLRRVPHVVSVARDRCRAARRNIDFGAVSEDIALEISGSFWVKFLCLRTRLRFLRRIHPGKKEVHSRYFPQRIHPRPASCPEFFCNNNGISVHPNKYVYSHQRKCRLGNSWGLVLPCGPIILKFGIKTSITPVVNSFQNSLRLVYRHAKLNLFKLKQYDAAVCPFHCAIPAQMEKADKKPTTQNTSRLRTISESPNIATATLNCGNAGKKTNNEKSSTGTKYVILAILSTSLEYVTKAEVTPYNVDSERIQESNAAS